MATPDSSQPVCWDTPDRFAFRLQLVTLDGRPHASSPELVDLDTGYDGEVLVPYALYVSSGLSDWELPQAQWSTGLTVSGESLVLPASRALLVIPELRLQADVLVDTFEENTEFLIGRTFMRRLRILLDGPADRTCILPDESSHR